MTKASINSMINNLLYLIAEVEEETQQCIGDINENFETECINAMDSKNVAQLQSCIKRLEER